jgi:3',5'-nucleoside bisphosphate phosphatase
MDDAAPRVDLHMHSTASDGSRSPADVVAAAKVAGLAAIALTDHDTVAGLADARAAGERLGVRVIAGVELSAVEGMLETHVLGLHLADTSALEARLEELREMRRDRAVRTVEKLNALGIPVTMAQVLEQAEGGAIGRPHIARAMVNGGWARDFRDAFDRYLGNGRPACVSKAQLPMREAIEMIHEAGGLAVLAHPGDSGRRPRLEALRALGLDGVEVLHPGHSPEDVGRLRNLSRDLELLPSGGSDWHGASEGPRTIGMMQVPAEWLDAQDRAVAARHGAARAS